MQQRASPQKAAQPQKLTKASLAQHQMQSELTVTLGAGDAAVAASVAGKNGDALNSQDDWRSGAQRHYRGILGEKQVSDARVKKKLAALRKNLEGA